MTEASHGVPEDDGVVDPAGELADLAHALARHVRRRGTLSRRTFETLPKPAAAAPGPTPATALGHAAPNSMALAPNSAALAPNPAALAPNFAAPAPNSAAPAQASARARADAPPAPVPTPARPPLPQRPPLPMRTAPPTAHVEATGADLPPTVPPPTDETPDMIQKKNAQPAAARTAQDVKDQARGARSLGALRERVAACEACTLCETRTQTVFMDGTGSRGVMFVGEAPGADEDRTGVPFVGRSGQLLTDIITKGMGIPREEVVIANVLKCRPPDNREPTAAEKEICTPWLDRQIELLDPKVIVPLGRHAAMHVLGIQAPMGAMRQKVHEVGGRKIVPTFHPSYLLRSPGEKKECWKDIQLAMEILGLPAPKNGPKP